MGDTVDVSGDAMAARMAASKGRWLLLLDDGCPPIWGYDVGDVNEFIHKQLDKWFLEEEDDQDINPTTFLG